MTKTELLRDRQDLLTEAKDIETHAKTESRDLTDSDVANIDARLASIRELDLEIAELDQAAMDQRLTQPGQLGNGVAKRPTFSPLQKDRTFAAMFPGEPLASAGWDSPEQFFDTIHGGRSDQRLVPMASLGGTTGAGGGFAIPTEYSAEWLDVSLETEIVRPRCQVHPMASDSKKIPGFANDSHASTLFGGFSSEWLAENEEATDSEPELRMITLHAKKLGLFTKASNELIWV